jgi:hypothetical protein
VVSFPQISPAKVCVCLTPTIFIPHAQRITTFFILSPDYYLARTTIHGASHYAVISTPLSPLPLKPNYPPQHPIAEYPQTMFFPQYERQIFTPAQNNRKFYCSMYFKIYNFLNAISIWYFVSKHLNDSTFSKNLLPVLVL